MMKTEETARRSRRAGGSRWRPAAGKYRPAPAVDLPERRWPTRTIERAPSWCSVDLRDGNQALRHPMGVEEKLDFFRCLVSTGFTEIETGFPAASRTEHDFTRELIEGGHVPEDVAIQVLTAARGDLIRRTFESLRGARRVIVHLYNSTSTVQRRVVFRMGRREVIDLAVRGTRLVRREAARLPGAEVRFEYSPESFTGTEPDFALEICRAVMEAWEPERERPVIVNLPATVEMTTPNVYADRIEWFTSRLPARDRAVISVHAHNDRGTAVAATELALLAGADRVEGTLFGNGERTGNVDLVTLAVNLFSQGIDPGLDLREIDAVARTYERCTGMPVHPRHPWAGELVYTAFSGSHQDAISKGMAARGGGAWEVPYLPLDPEDVGRTYESIIRINSQSGKGGAAWVLEEETGVRLPAGMRPLFARVVQEVADREGEEIAPARVGELFGETFLRPPGPFALVRCRIVAGEGGGERSGAAVTARLRAGARTLDVSAAGNGPVDAFCRALCRGGVAPFRVVDYHEHALDGDTASRAACLVCVEDEGERRWWGAGADTHIGVAAFRAVVAALNRAARGGPGDGRIDKAAAIT